MNKKLHITLAQINPIVGNLDYNFKKICDVWSAAPQNTDLVVFPELAICGYPPEDLILKPTFLEAIEKRIRKLKKFSKDQKAAALVPAPVLKRGKIMNAAHLIENGKIITTITKHHLPNYGVFDEARIFQSGSIAKPVSFRGFSLGIMICEDMWYPDIAQKLKAKGAEILIVPNASPYEIKKLNVRHTCAQKRIHETGLPLIYVNQVGGQDELVFDGASFVVNQNGQVITQAEQFSETSLTCVIEKNDEGIVFSDVQKTPAALNEPAEIYQALVLGLRDYISKNNFPGVLLGLSGGIDSALSAAIAVDALGAGRVHGVMLPSVYTSSDSTEDAQALAKNLGIHLDNVSIEKTFEAFESALKPHIPGSTGTTWENIQPRARGTLLMALSNASGKMVLSTGNKSEMAVGYATLYGDMCGGFNVLKDVYKTQVYELSNWRNKNKPGGSFGPSGVVIPARSITKAPTAELKPNQKDQDTLPEYETLDGILACLIEEDMGLDDIVAKGFDRKTVIKVWTMLDRAEYKRRQAPPGIKITGRAFGRDRRYPITNHFLKIVK